MIFLLTFLRLLVSDLSGVILLIPMVPTDCLFIFSNGDIAMLPYESVCSLIGENTPSIRINTNY